MIPLPPSFFVIIFMVAIFHLYNIFHYKHAIQELKDWPRTSIRNITHYVRPEVSDLPRNFCKYNTTLLIMVHSRPDNEEARNAIRTSWGNKSILHRYNTSLYFLLGQNNNFSIRTDTMFEKDLIVEDFIDSYSNLTLKSIFMLKLFTRRRNCQYLMKADEDVFVNIEALISYLQKRKPQKYLLLGRRIRQESRKNDFYKKSYAPRYMYLGNKYSDFLAGPAYVMNFDAGRKLYQTTLRLPLFHLEDVFVTGICAKEARIKLDGSRHFTDYRLSMDKCRFLKTISAHSFRPEELIKIQDTVGVLRHKCHKRNGPNMSVYYYN